MKAVVARKLGLPSLSALAVVLFAFIGPVTEMTGRLDCRFASESHSYARSAGGDETPNSGIGAIWAINDSEKIDKDDLQNPQKASQD